MYLVEISDSNTHHTQKRGSGILLHITSLPSAYGIGDLGPGAYRFAEFLSEAGQHYWQILPLNPTGTYLGNSPYTSYSAFAGNALLISPELLQQAGYLSASDVQDHPQFRDDQVDYHAVVAYKSGLLRKAFQNFQALQKDKSAYDAFCKQNDYWLDDLSLFAALKEHFEEVAWDEWPKELRDREQNAIQEWKEKLNNRMEMSRFFQFVFFEQWSALRRFCNNNQIKIIGDIPIYPSIDSSDAWANPEIFKLDAEKQPVFVAGAPPDYFSKTGQRWGNPVYDWEHLKSTGYKWWIDRIRHNLLLCDIVRVDHFRGFVGYWEIPVEEETAVNGKWVPAPAIDFFNHVIQEIPDFPMIVEDLGLITPDVKEVMKHFGFPGMKVLVFAFGPDLPTNPYAPHNHTTDCVVYTGTHDNNTIRGWYETEATIEDRNRLEEYLGHPVDENNIHREFIRLALASTANLSIIPMQDILGLGSEARMNLPSRTQGNWSWRMLPDAAGKETVQSLLKLTQIYGRV